jgi:uncharacterized protein YkwD
MHAKTLLRLFAGGALIVGLAGCGSTVDYQPSGGPSLFKGMAVPGAQVDTAQAISVVSQYRGANGLGPLAYDPELNRLAAQQAQAMARAGKMGHNVDGALDSRARRAGYPYARIAENIAAGHDSLADVFAGWRDSSGHRKNMLMPEASRMGIAVAQAPNSRYKVYWAMIVAEPPPARPTPVIGQAQPGPGETVLYVGSTPLPRQ